MSRSDIKRAEACFIETVKDLCRVCYTCVRECPAKAIRIVDGQAEVVPSRCIACGNCVKVCSQHAKRVISAEEEVLALLDANENVAVCVAPSFVAEFPELDFRVFVGMLRKVGFSIVTEVAFGADLIADKYKRMLIKKGDERHIATTCPAIVSYIEKYLPDIVDDMAKLVSPMSATARVLHQKYGSDLKIVFIGPCIAKKVEAKRDEIAGDIDGVLTFSELRKLFYRKNIVPSQCEPSDFDPPHPGLGALFPVTGGMFQSAGITEDLVAGDVFSASGLQETASALSEFANNNLEAKLLEVLCCDGCIMGPGMTSVEPKFRRRSHVSQYVRYRVGSQDAEVIHQEQSKYAALDLTRGYKANDQRMSTPSAAELRGILEKLGKMKRADELNCGACGYETCREHAIAIHKGLAENEMCLPFVIDMLETTVQELSVSHAQLASTQDQLMQSEKLASMGQLAAGVAHELNNPLGVVLMYSHLLLDDTDANSELFADLKMIADQAERGKKIVANLLDFARENKVLVEEVDIEQHVRKSTAGVALPNNVKLTLNFDLETPICELDPDQMTQVFTNLIGNAYSAMADSGGELQVLVTDTAEEMCIAFKDTGIGIPKENMKKVFQPFFTTKKIGKGTGLGLAVSYGIVKMHRGRLEVQSNSDPAMGPVGSTFTVTLPRRRGVE